MAGQVDPELKSVLAAWGRQQDAVFGDNAHTFLDLDLTMGQFRALVAVRRAGRLSGRELAAKLRVNPATVVPHIDRLEELGYLKRVPDLEDRRLTWLELTPKGDTLFRTLWAGGISRIASAISHLTPPDRQSFKRLLEKIADHLEAHALNADASEPSSSSPDRARRAEAVNSRVRRGAHSTLAQGPGR
jgi:MarR family transcriptional regulator, organic hydroperoxide resistance regulator